MDPEWERLYQQALLELDETALPNRISIAENAVRNRPVEFRVNDRARTEERQRLEDALHSLQCLRRISKGRLK
jgi:hypothetical protein